METVKKGISGSTLKMIAIITMLIDHVGAVIIERAMFVPQWNPDLYQLDRVLRSIGRIGFPIFCFLLVEGFLHTRNLKKYALRLALFALVSEIPFDFAFAGRWFYPDYQNVFFTLLIGLLVMIGADWCMKQEKWHLLIRLFLEACVLGWGLVVAHFMKTDYAAIGVLCIFVIYFFHQNRMLQAIAGAVAFCWEVPAPLAFLPVAVYNGTRGWNIKYVFYLFYPVHLLILYLIAHFMGIA